MGTPVGYPDVINHNTTSTSPLPPTPFNSSSSPKPPPTIKPSQNPLLAPSSLFLILFFLYPTHPTLASRDDRQKHTNWKKPPLHTIPLSTYDGISYSLDLYQPRSVYEKVARYQVIRCQGEVVYCSKFDRERSNLVPSHIV